MAFIVQLIAVLYMPSPSFAISALATRPKAPKSANVSSDATMVLLILYLLSVIIQGEKEYF
jgi:hypothetical protein